MDLYNDQTFVRTLIVSHANHPSNKVEDANIVKDYLKAKTTSATCTDDITIVLKIKDDKIIDAKYVGIGCAISTATTDMLLDAVQDKSIPQALKIVNDFILMTTDGSVNGELKDLQVFKNVYKQANRIACAQTAAKSIKKILTYENN